MVEHISGELCTHVQALLQCDPSEVAVLSVRLVGGSDDQGVSAALSMPVAIVQEALAFLERFEPVDTASEALRGYDLDQYGTVLVAADDAGLRVVARIAVFETDGALQILSELISQSIEIGRATAAALHGNGHAPSSYALAVDIATDKVNWRVATVGLDDAAEESYAFALRADVAEQLDDLPVEIGDISLVSSDALPHAAHDETLHLLQQQSHQDSTANRTPSSAPVRVSVLFATNRAPGTRTRPRHHYGAERGPVSYGRCTVSLPADKALGALPKPFRIWKLRLGSNLARHVVLLDVAEMQRGDFFDELRKPTASGRRRLLVFVHGFRVTFEDAARRTAQIHFDLQFDGVPVFFSWPSQAKLFKYLDDEATTDWALEDVRQFLHDLALNSGADEIHVLAHSMGNRLVARALKEIAIVEGRDRPMFDKVVLAAPDIDADELRGVAERMRKISSRLTMYASSGDVAIRTSTKFHGASRAGVGGSNLLLLPPHLDSIDASNIDTSFLAHGYATETSAVLADIHELINDGKPPESRFGLRRRDDGGWEFRPR